MKKQTIRYAVVSQGHISQVAVLPAFKQCKNSEVVALVSGDSTKLKSLSRKYSIRNTYSYDQYDACLKSGNIDAVYIASPNRLHRSFATRAAEAGIHVLCEKPLAVNSADCQAISHSAQKNRIKLMVAYRLHFDPASLKAIQLVNSGKLGEVRYMTSEFGYILKDDNIRALASEGGSPLHDIGIYCINAARSLFKAEPTEVFAFAANGDPRLQEIFPTVSAVMKFPEERIASFTCSFSSTPIGTYRVLGTRGELEVENGYEYVGEVKHRLTINEKTQKWVSKPGDQFAAEIGYFSDCILKNKEPEPSGLEGVADVRIIEALLQSIETGKKIKLSPSKIRKRPTVLQKIYKKPHRKPDLIRVEAGSK